MARKKKLTKKRIKIITSAIFLIVLLLIVLIYYLFKPADSEPKNQPQTFISGSLSRDFKIHFVDVGQGDGIIIELPDGKNMLIDAGKKSNVSLLTDYIDGLGIETFDYLLATHTDEDHIGGMQKIFDNYQVNYVFRPHVYCANEKATNLPDNFNYGNSLKSSSCETETYYNFLNAIVQEKSVWSFFNKDSDVSFVYTADDVQYTCSFDFLTPTAETDGIAYKNMNDYSPLIVIDYCGYKIMLTGDAETETEKEFVTYYSENKVLYDVDVLKAGHHGSSTSSSEDFLSFIKPENFIISCGAGNSYGHPHEETLLKFASYGTIFRTDVQGSIILTVDKEGKSTYSCTKTDYNISDLYIAPNNK